jgi:hypothetical protein
MCDNEDEAIITSIGHPAEDHVLVRVDDVFVDYKMFKCLLRRQSLCVWRCEYYIHDMFFVIENKISMVRFLVYISFSYYNHQFISLFKLL